MKSIRIGSFLAATTLALGSIALGQTLSQKSLEQQANESLGLERSQVVGVLLNQGDASSMNVVLSIAGNPISFSLQQHSIRSQGFQVLEQAADGSWSGRDPGPVRTYRGTLPQLPGSFVSGSWLDDGLYARVHLQDGSEFWIQPLFSRLPAAGLADHVLYNQNAVIDSASTCGTTDLMDRSYLNQRGRRPAPLGTSNAAAASDVADVAVDTDPEFVSDYGGSAGAQARIESVLNTMNAQYESEVGITHNISSILIRANSSPYSAKTASRLLDQMAAEWRANQTGVQRDVAHLFTGKSLKGGTIGIAYVGVICNQDFGFSLVESDFDPNFACATDLSAHELGHNWNAPHCSCTSNTMNPFITCTNTFHPSITRPIITAFRDSVDCLNGGGTGGTPVSIHVASITPGTAGAGRGAKFGTATVVIENDLGGAEAGASVSGTFSGDFNESFTGVTNSSGSVTFQTSASIKKPSFTFTVDSVSGSLPYDPSSNVETSDSL